MKSTPVLRSSSDRIDRSAYVHAHANSLQKLRRTSSRGCIYRRSEGLLPVVQVEHSPAPPFFQNLKSRLVFLTEIHGLSIIHPIQPATNKYAHKLLLKRSVVFLDTWKLGTYRDSRHSNIQTIFINLIFV